MTGTFPNIHLYDPALHLFVDDYNLRNVFGMKRVFGAPEKHPEPVLRDIDGRYVTWGAVMAESDGRFRFWYQSVVNASPHELADSGVWGRGEDYGFYPDRHPMAAREWQTSVISYAESRDINNWEKPQLGLVEWRGSRANNIVLDGAQAARDTDGGLTNMDSVSVLRDEAAPPEERYKLICHWETVHIWDNIVSKLERPEQDIARLRAPRAKYLNTSADGIHWNPNPVRIKNCAGGGDYCGVTRDERNGSWWFNDRALIAPPELGYWVRTAGLCASDDLYTWPETVDQVFSLGEYEDFGVRYEHHGMTPFNYGDQDLGYLEISIKGRPIAMLLVSHRDGQRWRRVNGNTHFLALGPEGAYDADCLNCMRNPPVVVGDKLIIPYNGRGTDNKTGRRSGFIMLSSLRLDGFAGLEADQSSVARHGKPAMFQTRPLDIVAGQLHINIEGHRGTARVGLLDESVDWIDGFRLDECLPIDEDNVRAFVRWKNNENLLALKGRKVSVMVQLQSGRVWSVRL